MSRWGKILAPVVTLAVLAVLVSRLEHPLRTSQTVEINYNGLHWTVETRAVDVAELLVTYFSTYADWQIDPAPDTKLNDGMTVTIRDQQAEQLNSTVAKNYKSRQAELAAPKIPISKPTNIYSGWATWYRFGDKLTAASRRYPGGTKLRVVAVNSGRSVDVVINDYGPSILTGIDIDLNEPAFAAIAPLGAGKIKIKYYKL